MAKRSTGKNGKKAGLIAFGATLLAYALIFPFRKVLHYAIGIGVAALAGKAVQIMASPMKGLDKNAKAKDDLNVTVIQDDYARQVVETGVTMLDALKVERDAINEYVFTRRIDALRGNFDQLLRTIIDDPDKASRIRKFNTYYFPTAIKLMQGYRSAKKQGTSYHTMSATREDILKMLDDLNAATLKLLDTMLQDDLEDMDIEMDVFDQMLKSDGLVKDELVDDMRAAAHAAAKETPMSAAPAVHPTASAPQSQPPQAMNTAGEHMPEAPVLNVPVTASAAQMQSGSPVLRMPDAPHAPDFEEVQHKNAHH